MKLPFSERTLLIVKPDGVRRGLTGEIIARCERAGMTVIGLKLLQPTRDQAAAHYATTDAQLEQMGNKTLDTYRELGISADDALGTADPKAIGKMVHGWNADFLSSGPIVAVVLEGVHGVKKLRALCGKTMPKDADPGTIRGDYASASPAVSNMLRSAVYNLVHASDNELDPDEPNREIAHWFTEDEIADYETAQVAAMYPPR